MTALRATLVRNNLTGPDGKFLVTMIALACALVLALAALSYVGPQYSFQRLLAEAPQSVDGNPSTLDSRIA
jgi:hypothetical protein